jgi:hypothetical protein
VEEAMISALVWLACTPKTAAPGPAVYVAGEKENRAARDPDEGPIAGPRNVVEEAPPPPPPDDIPGGGALPPYLSEVRRAVNDRLSKCLRGGSTEVGGTPALVAVILLADGTVQEATLKRASGDSDWDDCLLRTFRVVTVPAPPKEVLAEDGTLAVDLAFR